MDGGDNPTAEARTPPAPADGAPPANANAGTPANKRGADLARDALEAARARTAERRAAALAAGGAGSVGGNPKGRRTGSAASLRRRRWSGSGPDARDPAPLGATLKRWVKQAGVGADLTKATIFGRWPEIVGPDIADHCHPVSFVDGELLLHAESTAWATQIRMLGGQIMARVNREVGDGTVRKLRAQGPSGPSWRFGPRHVSGRGPRDTYG